MITCDTQDGVRRITLARPQKANALTRSMLMALFEAVHSVPKDLRALIISGEGKVFSAGADLPEAQDGLAQDPVWGQISGAIAALPCVSVAALNGTVAGGALGLVLACDLRLIVPGAELFYPVMRLGYVPPQPDPGRLAALIGPARARMLLLTGYRVSAQEALSWGLVNGVVAPETLQAEALALAAPARQAAPGHVAALKAALAGL